MEDEINDPGYGPDKEEDKQENKKLVCNVADPDLYELIVVETTEYDLLQEKSKLIDSDLEKERN